MRKMKKNLLALSVLGLAFTVGGGVAVANANAQASVAEAQNPGIYFDGAAVRTSLKNGVADNQGIRFAWAIKEADYAKYEALLQNYDVTVGTLVIPEDKLTGNLDLDNTTDPIMNISAGEKALFHDTKEGEYEYRAVVSDIPTSAYAEKLTAVGYITVSDGTETKTFYTEACTRDVSYVAYSAVQANDYKDATEKGVLDGFVGAREYYAITASGRAASAYGYNYEYAGATVPVTADVSEFGDAYQVDFVTMNGAAVSEGKFTMPAAEAKLSATISCKYNSEMDLRQGILIPTMLWGGENETVTVKQGETTLTYTAEDMSMGSQSMRVLRLDTTNLTRGQSTISVIADDTYNLPVYAADMIIKTVDDMKAFAVAYSTACANTSGLYALGADIDMGGWNITTGTDGAGTASTQTIAYTWKSTFDGRGYALSNVAYTHGLFATVGGGAIRNLAIINPIKATNGGGLIANTVAGAGTVIENCYVSGTLTAQGHGGLVATMYAGTIKNCVALVDNGLDANGARVVGGYSLVGASCTGTISNSYAVTTVRDLRYANAAVGGQYANVNALNAAASQLDLNGKGPWAVKGGNLWFGNMSIASQDVALNETNTIELTKINSALTADMVASVTDLTGASIAFTANGTKLTVAGTAAAILPRGTTPVCVTLTDGSVYKANVYVADRIISTLDEMKAFAKEFDTFYTAVNALYALDQDVTVTGFNTMDFGKMNNVNQFAGVFDGRGYKFIGAKIQNGFFPMIAKTGAIRNTGFTACTRLGNGGGAVTNGISGVIENCYIETPLVNSAAGFAGSFNASAKIRNCVLIVTSCTTASTDLVANLAQGAGKVSNTYAVSTAAVANKYSVGLYETTGALYDGAASKLNGCGYWTTKDNVLYFGNTEVAKSATSTSTYLVKNGVTAFSIVVPTAATALESYAAEELKKYLQLATGANFSIVTEGNLGNGMPFISVGETAEGIEKRTVTAEQAFDIQTTDESNIYLIGSDDYGTLFAVYEFLEQYVGWDCIAADEVIYKNVPSAYVLNLNMTDAPDFGMRIVGNTQAYNNSKLAYLFRFIRAHGEGMTAVNGYYYHNVFAYLAPTTYNVSTKTATYHPNWYSTANVTDITKLQLCYTAHGVAAEYTAMLNAAADVLWTTVQGAAAEKINVQFSAYDNVYWCECSACAAAKTKYGSESGAVVKFCNDLRAKLGEKMTAAGDTREVNLLFFAYLAAEAAPVTKNADGSYTPTITCADGVSVFYAPVYGDYVYSMGTNDFEGVSLRTHSATNYNEYMKAWSVVSEKIYLWIYGTNFKTYFLPYNTFDSIQGTLQTAAKYNVAYIFEEGQHYDSTPAPTGFTYLKDYLYSKLAWDVNADVAELTDKFFANYFGEAARYMRIYYNSVRQTCEEQKSKSGFQGGVFSNYLKTEFWPETRIAYWEDLIENAYTDISGLKTSDPERYAVLANRINIESLAARFIKLYLYPNSCTAAEFASFKADVIGYGFTEYGQGAAIEDLWTYLDGKIK